MLPWLVKKTQYSKNIFGELHKMQDEKDEESLQTLVVAGFCMLKNI